MEKRDSLIIIAAILVVLIMAIFVKPMVTGKEVKLLPDDLFGTEEPLANVTPEITQLQVDASPKVTPPPVKTVIPTPTPVPTWDGTPQKMEFETSGGTYIFPRAYPEDQPGTRDMALYSTVNGKYSGITKPITIPSGYWELWYTVELKEGLRDVVPEDDDSGFKFNEPTSDDDDDEKETKVESLSAVMPRFSITVIEKESGEIIRTITPEGGLNPRLWSESLWSDYYDTDDDDDDEDERYEDPRPWVEKFYEGGKEIYFEIDSYFIDSYSIEVKIPKPVSLQSLDHEVMSESAEINATFQKYIEYYNQDYFNENFTLNIYDELLSQNIKNEMDKHAVYQAVVNNRIAGVTIEGLKIYDISTRGFEGSLKGEIMWNVNGIEKTTPIEVPFTKLGTGSWKIDKLVTLRI